MSKSQNRRYASPNECRVIIREDLGYYLALVVGGIYQSNDSPQHSTSKAAFLPGLWKCIDQHPELSFKVENADTENPVYIDSTISNPEEHVEILPLVDTNGSSDAEKRAIQQALPGIMDRKFSSDRPPWRIVVVPFRSSRTKVLTRLFIAFAFSHGIGDGMSGLTFHKTFLAGLREGYTQSQSSVAPKVLPEAYDTPKTLPISWSFLLAPALGAYLPKFLASALGFRAALSTVTPGTWLGSPTFYDENNHRSGVRILSVDNTDMQKVLQACKKHNVKFTGVFHQLIVHALSIALAEDNPADNFVSQTAINMRPAVHVSKDQMGMYVSGHYDVHPRSRDTSNLWEQARKMGQDLQVCASTLQDQAVGLLRYLPSMRGWTAGKIGTKRDGSYEVSNLLSFDPGVVLVARTEGSWELDDMVFCQPANVTASPLVFSLVSRRGGSLVCTVGWQVGALDMGGEEGEFAFVDEVCADIEKSLKGLL